MAIKKHYPDINALRTKAGQVERAMVTLVKMGIDIVSINFCLSVPVIEVYHCPGVCKIGGTEPNGQGCNEQGRYVRKKAFIKGCWVEWSEQC